MKKMVRERCILAYPCGIAIMEGLTFFFAGMEAVWQIDVENFPAFIVIDDKGDDFFKEWLG